MTNYNFIVNSFRNTISAVWGASVGATAGGVSGYHTGGTAKDIGSGIGTGGVGAITFPIVGDLLGGLLSTEAQDGVLGLINYARNGQGNQFNIDQLNGAMAEGDGTIGPRGARNPNGSFPLDGTLYIGTFTKAVFVPLEDGTGKVEGTSFTFYGTNQFASYGPEVTVEYIDATGYGPKTFREWSAIPFGIVENAGALTDYPFFPGAARDISQDAWPNVGGVSEGEETRLIEPGRQASVSGDHGYFTLRHNGRFFYEGTDYASLPIGSHPTDTFTFALIGVNNATPATFEIVFNRDPLVANVTASVAANNSVAADAANGVLVRNSDLDGDTLTISANGTGAVGTAIAGSYGHLTLNADGSYFYVADNASATATSGGAVHDIFSFTVTDGHGGNVIATFDITITAADTPILLGSGVNDDLLGGAENNILIGGLGADILNGGLGLDQASYENATAGVRASLIYAASFNTGEAAGDSYISVENLTGSGFEDYLVGDTGANVIETLNGNDIVDGRTGNDSISGGVGDDYLYGGGGLDTISGGAGNDAVVAGGTDATTLDGGAGNDVLVGGAAADYLAGGLGDDYLYGNGGADVLNAGDGNDALVAGGASPVQMDGGAGNDVLVGGTANDYLYGGSGQDYLYAGAGDDQVVAGGDGGSVLLGNEGNDFIVGGGGVDQLYGGTGFDLMYGGGGNDLFVVYRGDNGDYALGQEGTDTLFYGDRAFSDFVSVTANGDGYSTVNLSDGTYATIAGIEILSFADGGFLLI